VSLVSVPLEDMTHTCVEECMRGGASSYAPKQGWVLEKSGAHVNE
jgi:hypothetical protein